jgi:pyruvate formate lyase activating enzyme
MSYSIACAGCNMRCMHCQNHEISQPSGVLACDSLEVSPEDVVCGALGSGCASIAYTYTEPTVFLEYALDIAKAACAKGLGNLFVSNGFMSKEACELILPHLCADNVDLKSFSDGFYRDYCGARLEPVLDTLKALVRGGVWVEVTTLLIPGLNDSAGELEEIASFIHDELGDYVPWHVSRFHPDHRLLDIGPTGLDSIRAAIGIGRKAGLKYVYAGNVAGTGLEDTSCPECGALLISREGFCVEANNLLEGRCPGCDYGVEGVWD